MPQGRYALGVASVADIVYVIGGIGGRGSLSPLEFFPQRDVWQSLENPFSQTWSNLRLVSIETHLYALGGRLDGTITEKHHAYQAIYTILLPVVK